jgi:hypothetical protein
VAEMLTPGAAKNYLKFTKRPMDLRTIQGKLSTYKSLADFDADVMLMVDNCKKYNQEGDYYDVSVKSSSRHCYHDNTAFGMCVCGIIWANTPCSYCVVFTDGSCPGQSLEGAQEGDSRGCRGKHRHFFLD